MKTTSEKRCTGARANLQVSSATFSSDKVFLVKLMIRRSPTLVISCSKMFELIQELFALPLGFMFLFYYYFPKIQRIPYWCVLKKNLKKKIFIGIQCHSPKLVTKGDVLIPVINKWLINLNTNIDSEYRLIVKYSL